MQMIMKKNKKTGNPYEYQYRFYLPSGRLLLATESRLTALDFAYCILSNGHELVNEMGEKVVYV